MLVYSTQGLPSSVKIAHWNEVISEVLAPLEAKPVNRAEFDAVMRCVKYGRLRLASASSRAATVRRIKPRVSCIGEHRFFLRLQMTGHLLLCQDRRETLLKEGDLTLSDAARPYTLSYDDACTTLVFMVSQEELRHHLPTAEEMIGVKLCGDAGLSRTAAILLRSVWERAGSEMAPDIGSRIADSILDVFATASAERHGLAVAESAIAGTRRVQIRRYIESHLHEPQLDVSMLAAAFGISTRYVHMLFVADNESVSQYILFRRLERCAKQLADPMWGRRTIAEIAFSRGFSNPTSFARAFRDRYGVNPREYRRQHLNRDTFEF